MTISDLTSNTDDRLAALRRSGLLEKSGREQFGALTEHVRAMLDVPVAIVSIVDEDRQVFAGHCGLPEPWASRGETPLTHSFCQHVVDRNEVLVIDDARLNDLVKDNDAIGDLGVIAYLGVPIALPTGQVVGALAAIDVEPRDWTDKDLRSLQSLARVVEQQVATVISEYRYRTFFEDMREGYYIAKLIRGEDGRATDLIFEDVNPSFEKITGLRAHDVIGTRLSDLAPGALSDMLPAYEQALSTGEVFEHANQVAQLGGRWFENRIRPLADDRVASIVTEVTARKLAEMQLLASEAHWRSLFEQLEEGFILGEVIRDSDGSVIDWRYNEVNRAWGDLVGVSAASVLGKTIREMFPGIEDEWVYDFAQVVDTQEPTSFIRQVGTIGRWYEGRAQPIGPDSFVVLFMEVTERIKAQAQQAAVLEFTDRTRDFADPDEIALAACEILSRTVNAGLVGYGEVDPRSETITVARDWTDPGVPTLAGTVNFRSFGSYIDDLKRGETVIVRDCETDPRTRDNAEALKERHARAFVNTPVFERGRFVGLLYVSTDQPRDWDDRELAFISDVAQRVRSATARVIAERDLRDLQERQRLAVDVGEVGIWQLDLATGELTLDARMRQMNGVTGDQLDGPGAFSAVHPDDLARLEAELARVASGENSTLSIQYRVIGIEDAVVRTVQVNGLGTKDRQGNITRLNGVARDVTERVAVEDRRKVMNEELAHRLKNSLALVQSIITQTLRKAPDIASARTTLSERIMALSNAHDILMSGHREAASVGDIIKTATALHDPGNRIHLSGPDLHLGARAALTLSLIVHELATNASKYGALSVETGTVDVSWSIERIDGTANFRFEWTERGGPIVVEPSRQSFGTRLIKMGLSGGPGLIEYAPEGVRCVIVAPVAPLQEESEVHGHN